MLIQALYIALIAVVYCCILVQPGMLLGTAYQKLWNWTLTKYHKDPADVFWLKPLISCEKCVAGQLAFWTFFCLYEYNLLLHVAFVSAAVFISTILTKLYRWTQQP